MHVPLWVPPSPLASGIYGASLSEMDALVGRIKRVADSHGKGNTLLWFTGTSGNLAVVMGDNAGVCVLGWKGQDVFVPCLGPSHHRVML